MNQPPFLTFLHAGIDRGGFGTDDALAALLPLMRQTQAAHELGSVAPLQGIAHLQIKSDRELLFDETQRCAPRRNPGPIEALQRPISAAVEVIGEARRVTDMDSAVTRVTSLDVGQPDALITKPVYLTGYMAWEQAQEHHDELTDIFSLGMLLASVACGLDFTDRDDLELFAVQRENLFALNARLNPVVASVIVQMTELNRHRRAQDLPSLIRRLEHYRDLEADLDLNRIAGFKESRTDNRRKLVQTHLRDRLFDMSRRNRLVYFKPTLQSLNLTLASVPLVMDYRNIRPEQLFTWHPALAGEITAGAPMSLGKYLRFEDAPYIPGVLDKIISEAKRDRAEFGFAQLRLVLVFLRWHNLKEEAHERIHSPLLLLPVQLTKKRGVRDNYVLDPTTSEAEVNPALRHHLKQLYNLDLPETVDLRETSLETFHTQLQALIQATEPAVTLARVDRPQIQLIHERARQRLDQYRRRTKTRERAARPVQRDYSYDRENLRPLGLQLFLQQIKPSPAPLRQIAGAAPAPRLPHIVESGADSGEAGKVMEKEQQMFSLRQGEQETGGNPYAWDFDLCSITLGNFNYRKMTLVQDYTNLIESNVTSDAFDRIFSSDPRQPEDTPAAPLPLSDQHVVIPCDATQATAIARARTGRSYIIQGPPGTGKSQTITNLIADYVASGKRVLFVCEKRAAIDVVFHRLRQQGLDELCCLIHDSQTDKKAFIQNLKQTCEHWLANPGVDGEAEQKRTSALRQMDLELSALASFSQAMSSSREEAGLTLRGLLHRLVELRGQLVALPPEAEEQLPTYCRWRECGDVAERLAAALHELGEEPCLAKHPLRWLNSSVVQAEHPLETLRRGLEQAETLLTEVEDAFQQSGLPPEHWDTIEEIETLLAFMVRAQLLAERNLLGLLDGRSESARKLQQMVADLGTKSAACAKAEARTVNWRQKLPADETQTALEQARGFKGSFFAFLNPAWWRLRRVLNERYDFSKHAVKPAWPQILGELAAEWRALEACQAVIDEARRDYATDDLATFAAEAEQLQAQAPATIEAMRQLLLHSPKAPELVAQLAALQPRFAELIAQLNQLLADYREHGFPELGEAIRDVREASDALPELLPMLAELAECPEDFGRALRRTALQVRELEAALAHKTLSGIYRRDRALSRFDCRTLARRLEKLEQSHREWLAHNAAAIRARVRRQFVEHVQVASLPAAQLTPEQKVFKKNYAVGRRELEHEFGKTMRYKSIRELASGNTGGVVRDLKPIWLMSPLSVSDTLPLDAGLFDVVIFDEASQIPVEEAVPALYRAHQVIVVGDEMQLPPTNFFTAGHQDEDGLTVEESGERIEVALDADSFLTQSAKNLPSTLLAWHYRSRYESLISYSNNAFYSGNLFTIPDRQLPSPELAELRIADPAQGDTNADALLARSISFHFCERSIYEDRRNATESAYIARLVRALLLKENKLSIGIVAFSEAQQTEIEDALTRLAAEDATFNERLEMEYNREEHDQFCGLFVKNLENVQGDERDIIILSVCYGYDANRRMLMNFGPINQRGGEKRLNVIFSRAKHHMAVVSSIRHQDITNDYNDGANALKNYLQFAEAVSKGDAKSARRVLDNLNPLTRKPLAAQAGRNAVIEQLTEALRARGYQADANVGQSRFRCDLAVRHGDGGFYQLGVLVDSEQHYANPDLVERYLMQPSALRAFGWRILMVLTKDWFHESDAVLDRIERILKNVPVETDEAVAEPEPEETIPPVAEVVPPAATKPPPVPIPPPAASSLSRRFEFTVGSSSKFWEISVQGASVTVRFGRIGTTGQEQTRALADETKARHEADKLIAEKLRKGYVETSVG